MKIELTIDEVNAITYALNELANKRQEQALDYHYNTIARRSNLDEAKDLRWLVEHIRHQAKKDDK